MIAHSLSGETRPDSGLFICGEEVRSGDSLALPEGLASQVDELADGRVILERDPEALEAPADIRARDLLRGPHELSMARGHAPSREDLRGHALVVRHLVEVLGAHQEEEVLQPDVEVQDERPGDRLGRMRLAGILGAARGFSLLGELRTDDPSEHREPALDLLKRVHDGPPCLLRR